MNAIVLSAKYPRDVHAEELESLATELRVALGDAAKSIDVRIEVPEDEHRVGVTFFEVIHAALLGASGLANLAQITQAARSWLKRRSKEKNDRRPRTIDILGADGKVIRRVELADDAEDARVIDMKKR